MTRRTAYRLARSLARRFVREERGSSLVEFAVVLALFLIIIFGILDFGRMAFHYVAAEKAMHIAARVAVVRPPVCDTFVPQWNYRDPGNTGTDAPNYGTRCNAGAGICQSVATVSCSGDVVNSGGQETVDQIWSVVRGALPSDASKSNLLFRYEYDENLGFLGGPYVPVVTVEIQNLGFHFISPFGALAGIANSSSSGGPDLQIPFPAMSVSLPGEDLAHGVQG